MFSFFNSYKTGLKDPFTAQGMNYYYVEAKGLINVQDGKSLGYQ